MENIKKLMILQNPEFKDVKIIEEDYFEDGRIHLHFENGKKLTTNPNSLINDMLGLILIPNTNC
jgi:hypothetical protein